MPKERKSSFVSRLVSLRHISDADLLHMLLRTPTVGKASCIGWTVWQQLGPGEGQVLSIPRARFEPIPSLNSTLIIWAEDYQQGKICSLIRKQKHAVRSSHHFSCIFYILQQCKAAAHCSPGPAHFRISKETPSQPFNPGSPIWNACIVPPFFLAPGACNRNDFC